MTVLAQLDRTILLCRDYVTPDLSDEEILNKLQSVQVLCVSDRENLSSRSGQTALFTLVSLLSRMGMQVRLKIEDAGLVSPQPPFAGESVCNALTSSSETFIAGATVRCDEDVDPDIVFAIGDASNETKSKPCWILTGEDWVGTLTAAARASPQRWTATLPVGAMVSAALAANEAFKFAIRCLSLRQRSDEVFFRPSVSCSWNFGEISATNSIDIGPVDFISAGAISQATLFALNRFPELALQGRIFDDDSTDASNLNRNMLTKVRDIGRSKVQIAAEQCGKNMELKAINERLSCHGLHSVTKERVIVGVDDIPSRWEVQRQSPRWVAVGGTSHFNVSSSVHAAGMPCCGCLHPVDDTLAVDRIPTISFVSFWAGLATAVRLIADACGVPVAIDRQHLWLTPLRMDLPHAAMWLPVAARRDCPVGCSASVALGDVNRAGTFGTEAP